MALRFGRRDYRFESCRGYKKMMEKVKIKLISSGLLFLFLCLVPTITMAYEFIPCGTNKTEPCEFCHIFVLINNIINFILTKLTPAIATLMLVVGGARYMAAGASENELSGAKEIFKTTVAGLLITLMSWIFLNMFLSFMGISSWTGLGTWWQIQCP